MSESPYFSRWEDQDYRETEPYVQLVSCRKGDVVLPLDDLSPWAYFLVNGELELAAASSKRSLRAGDLDAGYPVAHLRPSRYRVVATTMRPSCVSKPRG